MRKLAHSNEPAILGTVFVGRNTHKRMEIWSAAACCRRWIAVPFDFKGASKLAHSKEPAIFETDAGYIGVEE
jgi:hypothetical protein